MNANATFLTSALNKTNIGFVLLKNLCGILRALEAAAAILIMPAKQLWSGLVCSSALPQSDICYFLTWLGQNVPFDSLATF